MSTALRKPSRRGVPSPSGGTPPVAAAPAGGRASRVEAVDVSRGLAMVIVCAAHLLHVVGRTSSSRLVWAMIHLTMVASPMFMLLSGMMLGMARRAGPARFESLRGKLVERGVFLLTVGHVVILPSHRSTVATWADTPRVLFVTDAIAVALLVGPLVVRRTRAATRGALAAALVASSWLVLLLAPAAGTGVRAVVQHALVGARGESWWEFNFPFVPWLGLYLAGTVVGERIDRAGTAAAAAANVRRLRVWGLVSLGAAIVLVGLARGLPRAPGATPELARAFHALTRPYGKWPPTPGYFLTQGGLALLAVAEVFALTARGSLAWLRARGTELGQSSLAVFVAQYYLFYGLLPLTRLTHAWAVGLFFVASMALLLVLAHAWSAAGANRLLRVPGLPRFGAAVPPPGAVR